MIAGSFMTFRTLAPCPSSPNCVSTQAQDEGHAIALVRYRNRQFHTWDNHDELMYNLLECNGGMP